MILAELWKHTYVAYLQETHFQGSGHPLMKDRNYPIAYHTTSNNKAKGVSMLISRLLPWTCKEMKTDLEGLNILIEGLEGQQLFTFANVYFPNQTQSKYLEYLLPIIEEFITIEELFLLLTLS